MDTGPEATNSRYHFVFIFKQPHFLVAFEHQVLQRLIRNAKLTRHVHRKLLGVEIFNPTALRNADLRVWEELNVCRRVDLKRRDENVVNVLWPDIERSEGVKRAFVLFAD